MNPYLHQLNKKQQEAVETTEGPVLVLAGAGTGKTRVLTTRFAHILLSGKAYPNQILAVTFTNKASKEMGERVATLIHQPIEGLWLGSFHKICARMLRAHAELAGLNSSFTILDTDDQLRLIKQIIPAHSVNVKETPPQLILGTIQLWKDKGYSPETLPHKELEKVGNDSFHAIYRAYQQRLQQINACDFGDLMLHMLTIFNQHPDVLKQYQRYFRYIMVDEYQDTNTIQYLWLRLLAQRDGVPANLCCVGDDDQSIYSWRGAEIANILRFEQDFPQARIIRLENNYRSTPFILGAASGLISFNAQRLGKTLHPANESLQGEKVKIISTWDSDAEAKMVCDQIIHLQQEKESYGSMAILMRTSAQARSFEERMIVLGIPYKIISGIRFYERAEIRDVIAYMRMVAQPADDLALERIINVPKRGVGKVALQKIHGMARELGVPLIQSLNHLLTQQAFKGKMTAELSRFLNNLDQARKRLLSENHVQVIESLIHQCDYIDMWRQSHLPDAEGKLENIKELFRAMAEFQTLGDFLEHVSLIMDNDALTGDDKVSMMTLHAAKGLEFDTVFLPGWEEGLFPSQRTLDENGLHGLEEERRLAYVGITRAKKRLFISHAANRQLYGSWQATIPSRFLEELPEEFIESTSYDDKNGNPYKKRSDLFNPSRFHPPSDHSIASSQKNQEFSPNPLHSSPSKSQEIPIGSRVFHQKFGYGTVLNTDHNKLEIKFDKSDTKHVLDSFVTLSS